MQLFKVEGFCCFGHTEPSIVLFQVQLCTVINLELTIDVDDMDMWPLLLLCRWYAIWSNYLIQISNQLLNDVEQTRAFK